MSALTSLLVRDQKVPVRKIEEAIQRQVIAGGGFDTILLEAKLLPENEIASYCAAVHGLAPATRAECMDVPRDVVRTVPSEVAERHRLVPLDFDGQRLVVAVDQPLPFEVDQQLGFLLGVTVEQRIAPEMRIAAALQQHFGIEMVPRMRRLAETQAQLSPGATVFVVPLTPSPETEPEWPQEKSEVPTKRFGAVAEAPTGAPSVTMSRTVSLDEFTPPHVSSRPPPAEPPVSSPPEVAARLQRLSIPPQPSRISVPQSDSLRRHRGPLTAARAVELLKSAEERDEILEISFAFFRQFFDVSAIFVVQDGEAEGLEITGPGADLARFERLGVPLDEPSAFRVASEGGVPLVDTLTRTELDRSVRSDMARVDLTPVLLLPIKIRTRVVLIFYGDRSGEPFSLSDVPEPVAFAPRVSDALQQLILRRKIRGTRPQTVKPARQKKAAEKTVAPEVVTQEYSAPPDETPELADDESHVRWSEPPPPPPSRKRRGRERSPSFDVLGVPRSAPPPPMPGEQPQVTPGDDDPELIVEPPPSTRRVGSYVMKGGSTEVVRRSKYPRPPSEPSAPETSPEGDAEETQAPVSVAQGDSSGRSEQTNPSPLPLTATLRRPTKRRDSEPGEPVAITDVVEARKTSPETPPSSSPRPRQRIDTEPDTPSVIIEMDASIEAVVEDLRFSGPDEPEAAVRAVLQQGEAALPVLVREFPGPLFFDRTQPHRRLPRGRDISAVGRAIAAFGDLAVPYVTSLLDRDDPDHRFYAVLLSSEFSHARLVQPLGDRIFDSDRGVGTLALDVLRTLLPFERELDALTERLRAEARVPSSPLEHRVTALRALGELRDTNSLDMLVLCMDNERSELAEAAHRSLVQITRQDFGEAMPRWLLWIDENTKRHRIEWLIDSLSHVSEPMRREAADELKELTHEYYGYHPALSKKERETAQRKYRSWWESEGRARFAG